MVHQRWEGDARGVGVADGTVHLPELYPLAIALAYPPRAHAASTPRGSVYH